LCPTRANAFDAPTVGRLLRERLRADPREDLEVVRPGDSPHRPRILYNESVVLAELTFPQLLRGPLPMTAWWQRVVAPLEFAWTIPDLTRIAEGLRTYKPGATAPDLGTD